MHATNFSVQVDVAHYYDNTEIENAGKGTVLPAASRLGIMATG